MNRVHSTDRTSFCYAIRVTNSWLLDKKINFLLLKLFLGALDDFGLADQTQNQAGDVESSDNTANMEMWREKLAE